MNHRFHLYGQGISSTGVIGAGLDNYVKNVWL